MFEKMKNNYKNSVMISLSTKVIEALLYFLTDILAANLLSDSLYGEWCYFYTIITMIYLIGGFGINASTCVKVARTQDNTQRQKRVIMIGFKIRILVSISFAVLIGVLGLVFVDKFGYPQKYAELKGLFVGGTLLYVVYSVTDFFKNIYIGLEKMHYVLVISVIEYGGYLIFGGSALFFLNSIYGLEIGYIISLFASSIVGVVYMVKHICYTGEKEYDLSEKSVITKEILGNAVSFLIASSGTLVFAEMDTFLLGTLSTAIEVGNYSIAKNIISKATHLNYAICVATMPAFAYLCSENFRERLKRLKKLVRVNLLVALIIVSAIFVFGPKAVTLFYGLEYIQSGVFMRVLLIYFLLYIIHLFLSMYIDYQGKVKQRSAVFLSSIIFNLFLDILWIPTMGGIGAAIATGVAMLPYDTYLVIAFYKSIHGYQEKFAERK